ncbi:hypothetical protein Cni_G03184 [Canna indica]|uniref:Uncharacterized protein n=1 Tax=Canna indica TaxID=4628 RepID=A0AAQ3JR69_9LILI|nr:hypothetical protein Cni_G03184 [Canna indica]
MLVAVDGEEEAQPPPAAAAEEKEREGRGVNLVLVKEVIAPTRREAEEQEQRALACRVFPLLTLPPPSIHPFIPLSDWDGNCAKGKGKYLILNKPIEMPDWNFCIEGNSLSSLYVSPYFETSN